jgi:hypothetical protein
MTSTRFTRVLKRGLFLTLVVVLGLPAAAHADYHSTPADYGYKPTAPVHALEAAGGRMYLGTFEGGATANPDRIGKVVAVDAASGTPLWSVPTSGGGIHDVAVSADGTRLFVGGNFDTVAGQPREHLAALSTADGSLVDGWRPWTNREVRDLLVSGSNVYVAGVYERVKGTGDTESTDQPGIAAFTAATGERVAGFKADVFGSYYPDRPNAGGAYGLAATGGRLLVAGEFTTANGVARNSLAAFDLVTGAVQAWAPPKVCDDCIQHWDIDTDGANAYVASSGTAGHVSAFRLADGAPAWPAVRASGDVQAVDVGSDGLVYIGGHFSSYVGQPGNTRTQLAAVDAATGTVDPGFAPVMTDRTDGVWELVQASGRLVAGGEFSGVDLPDGSVVSPYLVTFAAKSTPVPPADPCEGLANCRTVATVDVNGDAARDDVVLAQRAGGFTLRVQTSTGTRSTVSLATRQWKGDPWQGAASLDTRPGRDLMVGRVIEGSTRKFTALTWRGSRLVVLDAPGTATYWTVSSSTRTKAGWLKPRTAPKGTVVRRVATRIRTSKVFRGKAITYRHTSRGWVAKSSTTKRRMTATAAGRWGGFSVNGLDRW